MTQAPSPTPGGPRCRQCGSEALVDLGEIPSASLFAGQPLEPPWPGGRLYQCKQCHLGFRDPVHDDDTYSALYARAAGDVWKAERARVDQRLVRAALLSDPALRSVLDVGCYDGSLLGALSAEVSKFGVEASLEAAAQARSRGISIVAPRVAELATHTGRYDAVTAVDVIEHLVRPDRFLELLASCLAPGGRLLISTGSLDTPAWQSIGGRYWYCQFPEHIAFVSPAWAEALAPTIGLKLARVERFAYLELDRRSKRRCHWRLWRKRWMSRLASGRETAPLGEPGLFEDHILLVFEKPHSVPQRLAA